MREAAPSRNAPRLGDHSRSAGTTPGGGPAAAAGDCASAGNAGPSVATPRQTSSAAANRGRVAPHPSALGADWTADHGMHGIPLMSVVFYSATAS
jgi:hypothetical protein